MATPIFYPRGDGGGHVFFQIYVRIHLGASQIPFVFLLEFIGCPSFFLGEQYGGEGHSYIPHNKGGKRYAIHCKTEEGWDDQTCNLIERVMDVVAYSFRYPLRFLCGPLKFPSELMDCSPFSLQVKGCGWPILHSIEWGGEDGREMGRPSLQSISRSYGVGRISLQMPIKIPSRSVGISFRIDGVLVAILSASKERWGWPTLHSI